MLGEAFVSAHSGVRDPQASTRAPHTWFDITYWRGTFSMLFFLYLPPRIVYNMVKCNYFFNNNENDASCVI